MMMVNNLPHPIHHLLGSAFFVVELLLILDDSLLDSRFFASLFFVLCFFVLCSNSTFVLLKTTVSFYTVIYDVENTRR